MTPRCISLARRVLVSCLRRSQVKGGDYDNHTTVQIGTRTLANSLQDCALHSSHHYRLIRLRPIHRHAISHPKSRHNTPPRSLGLDGHYARRKVRPLERRSKSWLHLQQRQSLLLGKWVLWCDRYVLPHIGWLPGSVLEFNHGMLCSRERDDRFTRWDVWFSWRRKVRVQVP
jgi:hypothetical protein